ncbi:MAG: hypothetical protein JNK58_12580, partial [Phycisphaerae bacterium]|nr:hypothetical protein [Phycisphaerae bacterium]
MGKLHLDGLLSDLGLGKGGKRTPSPGETPPSPSATPPSRGLISIDVDSAEPRDESRAMDGSLETPARENDVVPTRDPGAAAAPISEPEEAPEQPRDFKTLALESGLVNAKQFTAAETIVRQSPGTRLLDVLLEQGADECKLFEAMARSLGMEFRRLAESGAEPQFDDTLTQRLTPEFCTQNQVLPLSMESGRIVLGTARPDDVFLLDEVRLKLGSRPVKAVVVSPSDLARVLAPLTSTAEQQVDV